MPVRTPQLLTQILEVGRDQDIALMSAASPITYGQLRLQVRNAAAALSSRRLQPGERVLLLLPNEASFATAIFAIWRSGGVVVPMHHRSGTDQIVRIAQDCQVTAIICDRSVFTRVKGRLQEVPSLRFAVVKGPLLRAERANSHTTAYDDAIAFEGPDPAVSADPRDLVALMYTSGSTGRPKGVMHSHESLILSLLFTRDHLGLCSEDRVLISFPLYHLFSLRVLLSHLMVGATVIVASAILAGLKNAQQTRPNALMLVPAGCALLVEEFASVLAACAPFVRRVCIGSAAISPHLLEQLQRLLPDAEIHIPYGMTEARIGFLEPVEGRAERRLRAVDPNLELRVLDENGRPVTRGIGEIVLRGSALMTGYWHNARRENDRMRREGFRTRDLMEVTAAGNRFLVGRVDDVISVGGEKVFPAEVEAVLLAHPRIRDAHVRGEKDPRGVRGQVVAAAIVLEENAELDVDEIIAHCRARLEPYKIPSSLEPVAQIARTEMGKVTRLAPTSSVATGAPT